MGCFAFGSQRRKRGATNPRVQPRPAGGKPPAPQTALDRVEQRADPNAPVLGRATEGDSGTWGGLRQFSFRLPMFMGDLICFS